MFPGFYNADDAIAALETKDMIFAFRYLIQQQHPYLYRYLWQNGYYREEAEAIFPVNHHIKKHFWDNRVFKKLQSYEVTQLFVVLTLLGEANPADVRKFLFWRHFLPKPLYTVYVIDSELGARTLISIVTYFLDIEFFTVGSAANVHDSYEPLIRLQPDIVIIAHSLSQMDGITGISVLKPLLPQTAFLLMSSRYGIAEIENTFQQAKLAGADMIRSHGGFFHNDLPADLRKTIENFQTGVQNF